MKKLFLLIVFLIPLNLGKHFISNSAYVSGILVDYLIPTIYITDLLILVLLFLWIRKTGFKKFKYLSFNKSSVQLVLLFLFSIFLSVLVAARLLPSIYSFLRLLLYAGLFLYTLENFSFKKDFLPVVKIVSISVLFISVLGIAQWFKQASVFNSYLFLGEQPYSASTPNIDRKDFLGSAKVPSYSTFRHPNTFGGYLSVVLIWLIYSFFATAKKEKSVALIIILGFIALFFTLSKLALLSLIFGIALCVFKKLKTLGALLAGGLLLLSLIMPLFVNRTLLFYDTSFYRREQLVSAAFKLIKQHPLFGVGLNNSVVYLPRILTGWDFLKFVQPVHNVFLEIFIESGVFALVLFVGLLVLAIRHSYKGFNPLYISLLQIVILSSFDHYFWTANQTQILFWLTLALGLKYNLDK